MKRRSGLIGQGDSQPRQEPSILPPIFQEKASTRDQIESVQKKEPPPQNRQIAAIQIH